MSVLSFSSLSCLSFQFFLLSPRNSFRKSCKPPICEGEKAPAAAKKKTSLRVKKGMLEKLREGSRVHVLCKYWGKERLFKATVKEVLADSFQVIIHYDGKKATSVDTIAIESIDSFIGDETDPLMSVSASASSTKPSTPKLKTPPAVESSAIVDRVEPSITIMSADPNQVSISEDNLSLLAELVHPPIKDSSRLSVEYNRVLRDALQLYKEKKLKTSAQSQSNSQHRPGTSTAEALPVAVPSNDAAFGDVGDGYSLATTMEVVPSDDTTIATSEKSVASEQKGKKAVKQKRLNKMMMICLS